MSIPLLTEGSSRNSSLIKVHSKWSSTIS